MIHYHGTPIASGKVAYSALKGGHALVSFLAPQQLNVVTEVCQSFVVDNGAYSAWSKGQPIEDWTPYYDWVINTVSKFPNFDWAIIPDVIDGSEADNDELLGQCPLSKDISAPVWHMHESIERLQRLSKDYRVVCLGSSGEYASVGTKKWRHRMEEVFNTVCDEHGFPPCKLHGLRMLNPKLFSLMPLHSADSTTVGRNVGIDKQWGSGRLQPRNKEVRAVVLRDRIETFNGASRWLGWDYVPDDVFSGEDL